MVDFKDDGWNRVFMGLYFIFTITSTLGAKRPNIFQIHTAFSSVDFNKCALVADLCICDQTNHAARQTVRLLCVFWCCHC